MISEGSCDTKNWSNDAKFSFATTLINFLNILFVILKLLLFIKKYFRMLLFTDCSNKCSLGEQLRHLSKKSETTIEKSY